MRRARVLAIVVTVCALSAGVSARNKAPAAPKAKPKVQAADETARIEKLLAETKIEEIKFNQLELRDVTEYFREAYKLNVYVDWKSLKAAGVDKSTPVTLTLQDVTVARALEVVLGEASSGVPGGDAEVTYIVDKGVLVISTMGALARRHVTRIYPAADLLCRTRRAFTAGLGYPWRMTSFLPMEEEYERSTGAIFDAEEHTGLSRRGYAAGTEEASKELLQLIRNTIDRDSWGDPEGGGPGLGMIQVMGTSLVVTQTFKNHEAVAELLQMLRSDRDGRVIEVGVAVVRLDAPEAAKALRDVLAKAKDPVDVLTEGEDKGNWLLDRCRVEQTHLGDVIRVTHAYSRHVREVPKDANMIILPHTTMYGYEIGVLAKSRDGGKVTVSVACGSGWIGKDDDPTKDTPAKTTGVRGRQNVFDFAMPIGDKPRVYPVVPLAARDGGVKVVVWLPKSGK